MKKAASMNDVLRRAWLLPLLAALILMPACSSDSSEGGESVEMEESTEAPEAVGGGDNTGEGGGDNIAAGGGDATEVGGDDPLPGGAGGGDNTAAGGGVGGGVGAAPTGDQERQEQFRRLQEEETLAKQRADLLVDTYLTSARRYMANAELKKAESAILSALEARRTDQEAITLLREVRALQGQQLETDAEITQWIVNKRKLIRQSQVTRARDHYLRANQAFMSQDFETAYKELEQAELIIKFDPHQTDFGPLESEVPQMLKVVGTRRDAARRAAEERGFREAYDTLQEQEARRQRKAAEKVRQSMIRGVESFLRGDYDNAEFLARNVLADQPGHKDAKQLLENSQNARQAAWRASFGARKKEAYAQWLEEAREAQIPYTDILQWPSRRDWNQKIQLRRRTDEVAAQADDSEAVKLIKAKLENETITFDFGDEGSTFASVINHIRSTQGFNIIVDSETLSEKGEEPVTLTLVDQNLGSALKTLLEQFELEYVFRDDVLLVTTKEKALQIKRPYPRVYEVRDLTVSLPHFKAPDLALRAGGAGESAGRAVWGEDLERTQDTTIDRLVDLIRENVAKESWDVEGFNLTPSSGQIVAVTTPEIHREVESFLDDLRRFTKITVHVEARFISVQRGFLSEVGIDFRGLGGQNPGTVALLDDVTNGAPYNASAGLDNGGPGLPAGASLSPSAGAFYNDGSDGDIRGRTENIFDRVLGSMLTANGGASIAFQILDDLEIGGLFRAVEKNVDTSIVNAPRLTIFNNQRANLTLVNQIAYVKDYDVEVAQTAFIADPLIDVIQDGLTLDVRPTVSHDRKYVTLEVQPTLATLVRPIRTFETNLSGLSTSVVFELPEINYSQASTTVKVPDDGYVVIGGLKHVSTIDRRSETPILSNIPLLSFLFTRKGRSDEIRDLIIVIHVKILDLTEEEQNIAG